MAVLQKVRIISNERLDIPDFLNIENFACADFGAFFANYMGDTAFVVKGFDITSPGSLIGTTGTTISVNIASSVMFNPTSSNARGGFFVAPVDEPAQTVSLTPNTINYIELDQTTSTGAPDIRAFWDPSANGGEGGEYSQIVDTVTFLDAEVSANTVGFTAGRIPIAKVAVGALPGALITSITDCRPMFFRLGTGGTTPDPFNDFAWPNSPAGYSRTDVPVAATLPGDPNPFAGSDKNIQHFKDWMDAVMSRIRELDGGAYWFDASVAHTTGLAQNQNVHILDSGVLWTWNLVTETLAWSDTITFQIPGSTLNNPMVSGSVVIGTGQVAYVTIVRAGLPPPSLTPVVVDDDALPVHQDTFVFARRDGDDVIVGTHSFRVKPADTTESEYSDHLAKERILKPIVNQTAPDHTIYIYPSQRMSCGKRRYVYIKAKESSLFPRTGYLAGTYDGGANNDQLSIIGFAINGANLEVSATLPTAVPGVLGSTAWAPLDGLFTPVLIAISEADAITVTFGTPAATLAAATTDANLPIPTAADYPVAVVVVEMIAGVIQPIDDDHLFDRRPTGAGGSGSGSGSGTVIEFTALGGETLIDFTALPIPISYVPGTGDLAVIENGQELYVDLSPAPGDWRDYEETSGTSITLRTPAVVGYRYKFRTGAGITPGTIGDVVGPAGATDEALCRYDTATGKLIQNSSVLLSDTGDLTGIVDLTMTGTLTGGASTFQIESVETDGAAAVGFTLNTINALTTDGSKVLSVQNDATEYLHVRRGDNLYSVADAVVAVLNDNTGALGIEISAVPTAVKALMDSSAGMVNFSVEMLSDLAWGAGYLHNAITIDQTTNPLISLYSECNGVGTVECEQYGGLVGGGAGSTPYWYVDVIDVAGGGAYTSLATYTEDNTICNRTDVRFHAIAQGYIGLTATGEFFGADTETNPDTWTFESGAEDGATAIAYRLDTQHALANANALLMSLENDSVPKFVIDKDGNITTVGTIAGVMAESLLTAKGDIITATAASTPAVVSIGATPDGWVLTADSAVAEGVRWSSAGTGDVTGPASSTVNALVRWNSIIGQVIKDSGTMLDDSDIMTHAGAVNFKRASTAANAITLANALKATMNAHGGDGTEHFSVTLNTHTEPATVNGTAAGIITVADASAFALDDAVIVDDDGSVGPTPTVYIVGITDLGGPGPYELHIQDAPSGLGIDVDLSGYLVANSADVNLSGRTAPDLVNFPPIVTPDATDLTSLLTLTGVLLTAYAAHNVDALLGIPAYHNATAADFSLVSALAPVDLAEAITRLNDLRTKYNSHDADVAGHTTGSLHQEATAASTADYTTVNETLVAVIDTTAPVTVTLASANCVAGRVIIIKDESGGATAQNITVDTEGGETIDGAASIGITVDYGTLRVYSDGANWFTA